MTKKIVIDFRGKKTAKKAARKNLHKGLAIGAAAGTAIGALTGLLFAPKSGKETREDIADSASATAKKVAAGVKTNSIKLGEKVQGVVKEGKQKIFRKHPCCCSTESVENPSAEEASASEEKSEE